LGTSNWQQIPFCVELLMKIEPERVLDVGVGFGRWGIIVREFCDVWFSRVPQNEWAVHVEGIEAFEQNLASYHKDFYDVVHIGDAAKLMDRLEGQWDVVIFGDVIEHFTKDEGRRLLDLALERSRYVIVNVPLGEQWEQEDKYGNEYERHLASWDLDDFAVPPLVRRAVFRDFAGRPHATVCLSRTDPKSLRTSLFSRAGEWAGPAILTADIGDLDRVLDRVEEMAFELDVIKHYATYRWTNRLRNTGAWNALRWLRDRNAHVVGVQALGERHPAADGAQVWLLRAVGESGARSIPWDFVERAGTWWEEKQPHFPYGRCLVGERGRLRVPVGEDPELRFLRHPWGGKVRVSFRGRAEVFDLYAPEGGELGVHPARTPMAVPRPAATDTAPGPRQRGAFSSDEEAFIARTRAARARVVAVHCPRWLGITSSTRTLFDHTLAAPSVAKVDPFTLTGGELDHYAAILEASGAEHVVFSGGDEIHFRLMEKLARRHGGMRFDVLWHGSYVQCSEDYAWSILKLWVQAARDGKVHSIGTVKKGMERFFRSLGVRSTLVLNHVPGTPEMPPELPDRPTRIGIWISGASYRKMPHAMLAALTMLPDVRLHGAGLDARLRDMVAFFGITADVLEEQPLPLERLLQAIRRTHLSLYITFSECCPMLPLESMSVGVPCLVGPTSHLFEDDPWLFERLVVPFPDRADVIADYVGRALRERSEIMPAYSRYVAGYNERARRSVEEFLADGA